MRSRSFTAQFGAGMVAGCALFLASCDTPRGGTGAPATVPVAPVCAMHVISSMVNPVSDIPMVSERTDSAAAHGFVRLRGTSGPRGNSTVGSTTDTYAITEAWLRRLSAPVVFRAQAHPAERPSGDFNGSAWSINVQNASGAWLPVLFVGTAQRGNEVDDLAAGARTVPQLMSVGAANPQVFACAGGRTADGALRTTNLVELTPPTTAPGGENGGIGFIQDLLYGDDRFVPNAAGGPIVGPPTPPTPTIHGPGDRARDGSVKCAMTQLGDDVTTRELHMLAIDNSVLYHSMASNFGPATTGTGSIIQRFSTITPWADVSQALGLNFGTFVSATVVASRPRAISVFFVVQGAGNRYRLWHTVRSSASGGSWRPADDVLTLAGHSATGVADPFNVAAGVCPMFGEEATGAAPDATEIVYVTYRPDRTMAGGRIVSTPRQWSSGITGTYSPLASMTPLLIGTSDASRMHRIESVTIATRPFRDDATPPPP